MTFECTFMNNYNDSIKILTDIPSVQALFDYANEKAIEHLSEQVYLPPMAYVITEIYSKDHQQYAYTYLVTSLSEYKAIRNSDSRFAHYNDGGHSDYTWRWAYYAKRAKSQTNDKIVLKLYELRQMKSKLIKTMMIVEQGLAENYNKVMAGLLDSKMNKW